MLTTSTNTPPTNSYGSTMEVAAILSQFAGFDLMGVK